MAELKTKQNDASVGHFLNTIDDEQKKSDCIAIDKLIQKVTREQPKMWGPTIIGYGIIPYSRSNGEEYEWMQVGFSPRKQNITIYIMSGFEKYAQVNGYDPKPLLQKLGKFKTSQSCLYIKKLSDIDTKVLAQLVKESVAAIKKRGRLN